MTTVTLEVPDELASRVLAEQQRLPELLQRAFLLDETEQPGPVPLYQEILDFLALQPSLEALADFKISAAAQTRLEDLLERQREEGLSEAERNELDKYLEYRHVMILLKASARRAITSRPC